MLLAGSDDGVYRIDPHTSTDATARRVLACERVYRVRTFPTVEGAFAASRSGLYHTPDGSEWQRLEIPETGTYAVAADPSGTRLYAGTRPARIYTADLADGRPTSEADWTELPGFRELRERTDWGLARHGGKAQIRSLHTHPDTPGRIVAGLEVGGVFCSDDGGDTWEGRHAETVASEHPDDVHELAMGDSETFVAATGDGLLYTADAGRNWRRLDTDHSQRYFRGALIHEGVVYAGGAHGPSPTWADNTDHAIFEAHDGETLETVASPVPEELVIGWCVHDGDVYATTHRGSLLERTDDGYVRRGEIPTPGQLRGRYLYVTAAEL